jgi:hypothetical protein
MIAAPSVLLSLTIFLSAFLLFQVQPIMGRFVLPWFGGGPAVWTNCMLFFQSVLLAGYAYAHWLGARRNTRLQTWIHIALLAASLAFLPITPSAAMWKPTGSGDPSGRILLLLLATVGGPYLVLSATTPLLQRWFHLSASGTNGTGEGSPWRLYALSNLGSFLGLLTYPFLVEPFLTLGGQTRLWSVVYVIFAALCAWVAWSMRDAAGVAASQSTGAAAKAALLQDEEEDRKPAWIDVLLWLGLSTCTSVLLLATTNQVSQEVAVIPFLWIAPLSIYLLTFVLTFESDRWYKRGTFSVLAGVMAAGAGAVLGATTDIDVPVQLMVYLAAMVVVCMLGHGELAYSRPSPKYLTSFYLTISLGGALGGVFAALIAPRIFTEFTEYPIALGATCLFGFLSWMRSGALPEWAKGTMSVRVPLMGLLFGGVIAIFVAVNLNQPGIDHRRNFYGILRVNERTDQYNGRLRQLTHGRILHGFQFLEGEKKTWPTSYYGPYSGVALGITSFPAARKIGVVGLGAGTIAAWGRQGDTFRFYEINPDVEAIANKWFTFMSDSKAKTEIVLGDARLTLERELAAGQANDFDLIAVDAFSSDAIPVHLLTAEAADLYAKRLKPDGILALHISNRTLDLQPVTRGLAKHLGWKAHLIIAVPIPGEHDGESTSRWVMLAKDESTLQRARIRDTIPGWSSPQQPALFWTDDFSSLWQVLKF